MSIKSDRWIRKMAQEHGMIEPFEAGQVRFNDAGERLVSYGTSSYGYDVRCAPEFKVFTNVHSVIVDPKNFDEKSFIDVIGDECIIPPNSFALSLVIPPIFLRVSMLAKALRKCYFSKVMLMMSVRRVIKIAAVNTKDSAV